MTDTLILRADASAQIGTGHVMRCLALAQAWREQGGRVVFVTHQIDPGLSTRLTGDGCEVHAMEASPGTTSDAAQTIGVAQRFRSACVVADGYVFDAAYQQAIRDADLRVMVIDDHGHIGAYHADLILDQNLGAEEGDYTHRPPHTKLLLGTDYALLRNDFRSIQGWQRTIPTRARNLLVTLGGADPPNMTLKVIHTIDALGIQELEAVFVVGAANPHWESLQEAARASKTVVQLIRNTTDIPKLMQWADITVCAGGSTCWEVCYLGLPCLIVVLADNQLRIAGGMDRAGCGINLGWAQVVSVSATAQQLIGLIDDQARREKMSSKARRLVDGYGAVRVVEQIQCLNPP